jgi:hypothetical protein
LKKVFFVWKRISFLGDYFTFREENTSIIRNHLDRWVFFPEVEDINDFQVQDRTLVQGNFYILDFYKVFFFLFCCSERSLPILDRMKFQGFFLQSSGVSRQFFFDRVYSTWKLKNHTRMQLVYKMCECVSIAKRRAKKKYSGHFHFTKSSHHIIFSL